MTARTLTSSVPSAATTAEVFEFKCLYTRDIVRKQKRWTDGRLKFHKFNKLVAVADLAGYNIGRLYVRAGEEINEGDELKLDNGVLVEVQEPDGRTESDISELFERRPKEIIAEPRAGPKATIPAVRSTGPRLHSQTKPLSAVLGTPQGRHGRAFIETKSPYEQRNGGKENCLGPERAAKRQRVEQVAQARNLAMASPLPRTKTLSDPMWARTAAAQKAGPTTSRLSATPNRNSSVPVKANEPVDITSDAEEAASDLTLPPTPPGNPRLAASANRAFKTPRPPPPSSPPISTKNKVVQVQQETDLEEIIADAEKDAEEAPQRRTKALKLASGPKRKLLLCQEAPGPRANTKTPTGCNSATTSQDHVLQAAKAPRNPSDIRKLPNGFTQISSSPTESSTTSARIIASDGYTRLDPVVQCGKSKPKAAEKINQQPIRDLDRMALDHGRMDQRIMGKVPPKPKAATETSNPPPQPIPPTKPNEPPRDVRRTDSENDLPPMDAPTDDLLPDVSTKSKPARRAPARGPKRTLQRNTRATLDKKDSAEKAKMQDSAPPSPVRDTDVGPWSTEVMDLFDWRPPGFVYRGPGLGFGISEAGEESETA